MLENPDPQQTILMLTSMPDIESASQLARYLVQNSLAASVNLLPQMTSFYRWQGELREGQEHLLIIQTIAQRYTVLETEIKERHPYELPKIITVPITRGLNSYLDWIKKSTYVQ